MDKGLHQLDEYFSLLEANHLIKEFQLKPEDNRKNVEYISNNSQDIRGATLFVCKGSHFSVDYLKSAVTQGAIAYLSEVKYDLDGLKQKDGQDIPYILVKDIRKAMALIADLYYGQVWKKLNLIGITGTKGKSTTAYFMKYILDEFLADQKKPKSAIVSGIDNYDGIINEESHLTTPEAFDLHRHFNNAVKSNIEYLSMEVSSQALKYDRTLGITFDVGCFLNIGEDHISDIEHTDFDDYLDSKLRLFRQCRTACVNLDTECLDRVLKAAEACPRVITFGLKENADVYGYDIVKSGNTITFKVRTDSFVKEFTLTMSGLFNVQNALAAIAISVLLNIPLDNIYDGLRKAKVSGRMEVYTNKNNNIHVIVDYAHNKLSFETLFQSTKREYPDKKIAIVFGCPGKKAFGRRRELGELAGKYSDQVYITEEDAGEESVIQICEEIAKHVEKQDCRYVIIPDREEAIKAAITNADDDTVILITGKGRETRQKRGTKYVDTPSDVEYVKKYLDITSENSTDAL